MNTIPQPPERRPGTAEWPGIADAAELLAVRVGAWNCFGHPDPEDGQAGIPPLGERNAEAITAGHGAIEVIDKIMRDLHAVRSQLIDELRANADENNRRVDAMLAESRARRDGAR